MFTKNRRQSESGRKTDKEKCGKENMIKRKSKALGG